MHTNRRRWSTEMTSILGKQSPPHATHSPQRHSGMPSPRTPPLRICQRESSRHRTPRGSRPFQDVVVHPTDLPDQAGGGCYYSIHLSTHRFPRRCPFWLGKDSPKTVEPSSKSFCRLSEGYWRLSQRYDRHDGPIVTKA